MFGLVFLDEAAGALDEDLPAQPLVQEARQTALADEAERLSDELLVQGH
jgi:hypothetical protein